MSDDTPQITQLLVETTISAPAEAVWRALTVEVAAWWPEAFYSGGEDERRRFVLEARPGGRMYEEWGDGDGVLWGTVHVVERGRRLEVAGVAFPAWGGPSVWTGSWRLEEEDGGTRVRFTEAAVGRLPEGYREEKEKGWRFLFEGALKAHLEGSEPPRWEE